MVCKCDHNFMGMSGNDLHQRDWLSVITGLQHRRTVLNWKLFAKLSSVQFSSLTCIRLKRQYRPCNYDTRELNIFAMVMPLRTLPNLLNIAPAKILIMF
jgi:hypothetical protein